MQRLAEDVVMGLYQAQHSYNPGVRFGRLLIQYHIIDRLDEFYDVIVT